MNSVRTSLTCRPRPFGRELEGDRLSWRDELRDAVRDIDQLCGLLELPAEFSLELKQISTGFPLIVPRSFVRRMKPGDPFDPLLRQILPVPDESKSVGGYTNDPVGDLQFVRGDGVIHKYHGRALLIAASTCAVHCRYCFRREFPYESTPHGLTQWMSSLDQIAGDESIREVILSGGDPLMLVDDKLSELIGLIESIPHVQRLRIHTRLPVVIPSRVTNELVRMLCDSRLATFFVVHANHANEIDLSFESAISQLIDAGIPVLNQAVLLRGVNDTVDSLRDLFERLANIRVLPYYLHQLDRINGAAHFEVSTERGIELMRMLHCLLPGYALPRYVTDDGSNVGKRILF